jgi:hypothetical protein
VCEEALGEFCRGGSVRPVERDRGKAKLGSRVELDLTEEGACVVEPPLTTA